MTLQVGSRLGPTLADRIKQGPIPVDEAPPIAKQIAEALEAPHEQSVIHRDLVARFEREAKVLASLNHPNIAASHGLERASRCDQEFWPSLP